MKRTCRLSIVGIAIFSGVFAAPRAVTAESTPVLAQDLQNLRVPGKVAAVLWTRRGDHFTLQVVFPRRSLLPQAAAKSATGQTYPQVYAWLLKSNGEHIVPTRRIAVTPALKTSAVARGQLDTVDRLEVLYEYPLTANRDAVAVALQIDDEYVIQKLEPFSD